MPIETSCDSQLSNRLGPRNHEAAVENYAICQWVWVLAIFHIDAGIMDHHPALWFLPEYKVHPISNSVHGRGQYELAISTIPCLLHEHWDTIHVQLNEKLNPNQPIYSP